MPCEAAASECMPTARLSHHTVHTNNALARADDNDAAAYTLLVSADDPNIGGAFRGNWIETTGHECGTMCFRWVAPRVDDAALPHPVVDVVRFADIVGA